MSIQSFKDLEVWKKAMDLVTVIYAASSEFPADERFGLTSQVRRAGVSIPSNIAEGQARHGPKEFLHFLHIARGSLAEVRTQLEIALRLSFLASDRFAKLEDDACVVGRMLNGLINAIERKIPS
jgi:four helix bundle protein